MSFALHRVRAVAWKDTVDLLRHKALLGSMLILPLVLVVVPVGIVFAYARDPSDPSLYAMASYYQKTITAHDAARFLIEKTLTDWFGLFLMMPVFVPILISSHSVAGEKERRTLEPLLSSPITSAELVAGKSLAALLPALAITWVAFGLFCAGVDAVSWHWLNVALLPNGLWLFGVALIAPLFAYFGNGVAVLVSARVGESRLAQQLSALVILPLVGLFAGQMAGWLRAGPRYYALEGLAVLGLDLLLVWASVRLFDRERLLTRWS